MSLVKNYGKPSIDGTFDLPPDLLRSVGIRGEHKHEDARRAQRIDDRLVFQRRNLGLLLVFPSGSVRHRFFAGFANIGEVIFHAGLDAAQVVGAKFRHVSSTGLYCYSLEHQGLTRLG